MADLADTSDVPDSVAQSRDDHMTPHGLRQRAASIPPRSPFSMPPSCYSLSSPTFPAFPPPGLSSSRSHPSSSDASSSISSAQTGMIDGGSGISGPESGVSGLGSGTGPGSSSFDRRVFSRRFEPECSLTSEVTYAIIRTYKLLLE